MPTEDSIPPREGTDLEPSILAQVADSLRSVFGLKRSAEEQARVDLIRALQPHLEKLDARAKAYKAVGATQRKTLSGVRETCETAADDPALAHIVAPLQAALDSVTRQLRSVPMHYAKLAADVKNATTMQDLVDAAAEVRYEAKHQCGLPAEPALQAQLDAVEEIARKVNRELAAVEKTRTPAGPGPSHAAKFVEWDATRPAPGPREAITEFNLFEDMGKQR
jgi:ABC-type transporter Mla subunit MlaD